jgi:phosphoribosylaminoimidazolecarboxamide formyltransferase/IMP cyclohydrolase
MKRRALMSVYDKDGILDLAKFLEAKGWEIISTGGTFKYLQENNIAVTGIESVTQFPEMLDGRVKTLHPIIHAGLLARRDNPEHMKTIESHGIGTIDLVCVNLYPFFEKVQAGLTLDETVEFIDIGGPTMLRSAAKNFHHVLVLTDPADYDETMKHLEAGNVPDAFKKKLAGKVFNLTSAYDAAISRYLLDDAFPEFFPLSLRKAQSLRYGENGHQTAALYSNTDKPGVIGYMQQIHGKELSYNNIRDLDLAWKTVCAYGLEADNAAPMGEADVTAILGKRSDVKKAASNSIANNNIASNNIACVAVKHNTPCGAALGANLLEAYEKCYACDPVSIFGGIITCNVKVDEAAAKKISEIFFEIIAAPDFDEAALSILQAKKNLRIIKIAHAPSEEKECTAVDGGMLVQDSDRKLIDKWEVVTKVQPDPKDIDDMLFGMRTVSFVKSNAIVIVKDGAAVGIGGGQTNRIWPAKDSLARSRAVIQAAKENGTGNGEAARVLASDAFFPFPDIVEAAAEYGIKTIVQPGGSINDKLSIEACDKLGIAMVFTGVRHFKH